MSSTIHGLVEAQADRTPDAVALVFEQHRLSYGELNRRANQIAHYLRRRGVQPETPVAICMSRSLDVVAGILGILKAGGAFVPLDPVYPPDRLAFMLEDTGAPALLSREPMPWASERGIQVVSVERDQALIEQEDTSNPAIPLHPASLAYVIYTSGSTGRPKGVAVEHGSVADHCRAIVDAWELSPQDRVLEFASFTFDVSIEEVFPALSIGATVVLRGTDGWNSDDLTRRVQEYDLTVVDLPTAYWQQWVEEYATGREQSVPPTLRLVVIGGDAVMADSVRRWRQTSLRCTPLLNAYGPTEATVTATIYEIPASAGEDGPASVPIGYPLPGRAAYVLDQEGSPVAAGEAGELYLGGAGLARGYLGRPELTVERFLPDPSTAWPGARMYRTGDLARTRPDGALEFLGRIDHQVKIRGFRIELGEVETALSRHPAVDQAVVVARPTVAGDKQLVAYAVPSRGNAPGASELRGFLRDSLPEYMLPAAFVVVDALPTLPNGKINRAALPEPGHQRPELDHAFVPPRNTREHRLAEIWSEILGLEEVGIEDSFFDLGGDSLVAMQMIARAKQQGMLFRSDQLLRYPTIAELATMASGYLVRIKAEQGLLAGPVPLTPTQRQYLTEDHGPAEWIERTVLELQAQLDPSLLDEALQRVLEHHDMLRARFRRESGEWVQSVLPREDRRVFSSVDVRQFPAFQRRGGASSLEEQAHAEIDIMQGPLVRALHINRSHKPSRLILLIHHLVVDAYSIPILVHDLEAAYLQLERGEAVQPPPKTTSYREWAEALTEYAHSDRLRDEIGYWTGIQAQARPLPADAEHPGKEEGHLQYVIERLSPDETSILTHTVTRALGVQIIDILLTALALGFRRWTGRGSLVVDLSGHGREALFDDMDVSRTLGWFSTAFPVLVDVGSTSRVDEAVEAVAEQLRQIPDGGIGYGVLRYLSQDERMVARLRGLPAVDVALNYLGRPDHLFAGSSLFRVKKKVSFQPLPQAMPTSTRLPVSAQIHEGSLYLRMRYHEQVYRRETIERVMRDVMAALRAFSASRAPSTA